MIGSGGNELLARRRAGGDRSDRNSAIARRLHVDRHVADEQCESRIRGDRLERCENVLAIRLARPREIGTDDRTEVMRETEKLQNLVRERRRLRALRVVSTSVRMREPEQQTSS